MDSRQELMQGIAKLTMLKGKCYMNVAEDLDITDLSLKQIDYLKTLNNTCCMTTSKMAEILDLSKPTVTEMVKKFIKIDCVYKVSCPEDGRKFFLNLTERGQRIVDMAVLTNSYLTDKLIDQLSDEDIAHLTAILMKLDV